ncbi:MULE transposase domain-containing protein [Hirsutella rhossiliensis]|uniref:MULE transposase domain-containing protein n=1 Tax=Hirsutella rhossiliensis TaxID=111463 RepID=A0A9P8SHS5_9HYPO|nr:MULE transposase domain-containing protein [Hirsutella rhossiliensis]KAH0961326.1 MULE transposase domain-containing protein [Hirsutella rhossiliensis]
MASPALIPALPPTLPEPGGELPVDSADEFSESNDCDDFHDNDDWDGQPWEVVFPSDSPLLTTSYESFDRLLDVLKAFCIQNRMGIVTIRKSAFQPKGIRGQNSQYEYSKDSRQLSIQSHRSILQANNYEWSMRIVSSLHRDHGPSQSLSEHYHWRKLTAEQMKLLEDLCLDTTISSRSVHKQLCHKWPKIPVRRADIYNWRWKVNQAKRQGYGPANDFVRTLSESKKVWIWGLDWIEDEFRFRHAAWGYHQGGKMWQQFLRAGIIRSPEVVITDMDDQLRNAIRQIFPNTQLQLCVFHINSNVVSYIKKWWKKDNDSDLDDDAENWDNTDALDVQEMERENTEVKT